MLKEESKRQPRNKVARFIIEDLDRAIELMSLTTDNGKNRLTKNVALLFKSRVALFEATWLKYHKGTDRVPGGPGWPGAQQEYNAGFSIDIDKEVDWFLEQAMDASAQVADRISLTKNTGIYNPDSNPYNWNPYFEMFSAVTSSLHRTTLPQPSLPMVFPFSPGRVKHWKNTGGVPTWHSVSPTAKVRT